VREPWEVGRVAPRAPRTAIGTAALVSGRASCQEIMAPAWVVRRRARSDAPYRRRITSRRGSWPSLANDLRNGAVFRMINPGPVFGSFAESPANGVQQNIADFSFEFVVVTQAVIEEISLPADFLLCCQKVFPIRHGLLHARRAGEGKNGMQMIGHQEHKVTVPKQALVIMRGCRED